MTLHFDNMDLALPWPCILRIDRYRDICDCHKGVMQALLTRAATSSIYASGKDSRHFWSAFKQAIRQVKGDDLKHEQFRQDLHYLYLLTAVHDHVKNGDTQLGNNTQEVADNAIAAADRMKTEAMYSSVNASISSSLRQHAGSIFDVCNKAAAAAADALSSTEQPDSYDTVLSTAHAETTAKQLQSEAGTSNVQSDEGSQGQGAEPARAQLGRSHVDSKATQAVQTEDAEENPEEAPYEPPRWLAGREKLTNKERRDAELMDLQPLFLGDELTSEDLKVAASESLGFRLELTKSGIEHEAAGDGVWLRGSASIGAVVAIHPGVVYSQAYHTEMKGFPNITTGNDAILARYDNTLVDAKPWGRGQERGGAAWVCEGQPLDRALHLVDGRHPLALAQFVNHPPPGVKPNVLLAPFDLRLADDEKHLRRFLPYAVCASTVAAAVGERVSGLVLIARRALEDEELFMDYRLNPNHPRPGWYQPVDALAERRRWA